MGYGYRKGAAANTAGANRSHSDCGWSPDGNAIAVAGKDDDTLGLWEVTTGKELHRVSTSHDGTSQIAFAADGKTIVSLGETGAVRLWETATLRLLLQLATPAVSLCVALSPDGKTIATGGSDGVLRLWKSGTNREIQRSPDRHIPPEEELQHRVWNVAFSPNGNFVAWGGDDGIVRIWDVRKGKEIGRFEGHREAVYGLGFSTNSQLVASASGAGIILLWDISHLGGK